VLGTTENESGQRTRQHIATSTTTKRRFSDQADSGTLGLPRRAYLEQREALDALLAGAVHFDLVVTDFNMPGISGLDVARAIHNARPDLPVIVVSGYITDALRAQAAAAGVRELISKPHEMEELRDVVQRLLPPPETMVGCQPGDQQASHRSSTAARLPGASFEQRLVGQSAVRPAIAT
jgi:CheY-like chemotaxis protein